MKNNGGNRLEYERMIEEAGFRKPTLLQQLILPPILEGRDVDAESGIHPGKTLAIAVGILAKLNKSKPGTSALVLTKDREQAQKVFRAVTQLLAAFNQGAVTVVLGFSDLIKKEARQLMDKPDIVVSTPSRLIDHIRRSNIELGAVERVFIDEEEEFETEFESDICYILSKVKDAVQIVRFAFAREGVYATFEQLLKRPVVIREKDFMRGQATIKYSYLCAENKEELVSRVMMALSFECVVVVIDSNVVGKKIQSLLNAFHFKGTLLQKEASRPRMEKSGMLSNREDLDFIISPQELLSRFSLEGISHIINYEPSFWESDYRKNLNLANAGRALIECISLVTPEEEKQLAAGGVGEKFKMERKNPPVNEEIVKGTIERLLENTRRAGESEDIKEYLAAVKKGVPWGKRSLFIASLLKEMLHSSIAKKIEFATLFLSIGRTKHVTPKEIAALFIKSLSLDKSRLGDIRVFDNYSFVEIDKDYADKAIASLSQTELSGKKLIVNYSRKKDEPRRFERSRRRPRD